jgi:hypothetical protein
MNFYGQRLNAQVEGYPFIVSKQKGDSNNFKKWQGTFLAVVIHPH